MILGIFSDLHSNFSALRKMISMNNHVDKWISLGDFVGLYPDVNEVLDWHRLNVEFTVRGNHENSLINNRSIKESFTATDSISRQYKEISNVNYNFLKKLNSRIEFKIDGLNIFAKHILNEDFKEGGKYHFDISLMEQIYQNYDLVLYGDTHLPTIFYGKHTIFLNPGSAGFPVSFLRKCSMILFNTIDKEFKIVHFDYDKDVLINSIKKNNYHSKLISFIKNNHYWK